MEEEVQELTILQCIILLLIGAPLFLYFCYLCGLSLILVYDLLYLWLREGISINSSLYTCITSPSKHCSNIMSYLPFSFFTGEFSSWLMSPQDWVGVHSMIKPLLEIIPFWLFSVAVSGYLALTTGWMTVVAGGKLNSKMNKKARSGKDSKKGSDQDE